MTSRNAQIALVTIAMALAMFAFALAPRAESPKPGRPSDQPTVLFMCPHGAAKSVLASAYFQRLAKERGLNLRVQSAGIEPDETVSAAVAAHLERQGYEAPARQPRKATARDVESADVVISIGCDLSGLPQPTGKLERWDDVPGPGEDFAAADQAIRERVRYLVQELVRAEQAKKQ